MAGFGSVDVMVDAKSVDLYAEGAGSITEAQLTAITVNGEAGKEYYKVPKGFKLKLYEIEINGEVETRVWIKVGDTETYADSVKRKKYKLASAGHLHPDYKFPFIIEAFDSDKYVFLSYIQTSAEAMVFQAQGEIKKLHD